MLIDYGSIAVGIKSGRIVTVRNDGTGPLELWTLTLVGPNPDQFILVAANDLCTGRTLAAGQSCTVAVRFKPTTAGFKIAKLRIASNDSDEADREGEPQRHREQRLASPEISVTPSALPFGTVIGSQEPA